MRYVGGKSRHAAALAEVIERYRTTQTAIYDPFVGGGAMAHVFSTRYSHVYASDTHRDLIMLYHALQQGWKPPTNVSEDEYQQLRHAEPSALRGFVGFGASWNSKWFGGYAKDKRKQDWVIGGVARSFDDYDLTNVSFSHASFFDIAFINPAERVIYCDPPYQSTQGYSVGDFDHDAFWQRCNDLHDQGFLVAVSEYNAPDDWQCVWRKDTALQLSGGAKANQRTERLFIKPRPTAFYMF